MKTTSEIIKWLYLNDKAHPSALEWRRNFIEFLEEEATTSNVTYIAEEEDTRMLFSLTRKGYENTCQILKSYELSDKNIPSYEKCLKSIGKTGIKNIERPVFLLIPPVKTLDLIKALDKHKMMPNQTDTYYSDWFKNLFKNERKPSKWQWAIVEGAQELEADPKLTGRKLKAQLADFTKENDLITIKQYIVLMMMALYEKKPLDIKYWSVLAGDDNTYLPGGRWGAPFRCASAESYPGDESACALAVANIFDGFLILNLSTSLIFIFYDKHRQTGMGEGI